MRPLITILILLVASVATAQPLVLSDTPSDGVYVLKIQGGEATIQKAIVLIVDGPPTPTPIDPVTPVTDRAKEIRNAAQGAVTDPQQATTAANLSAMMGMIEGQINAGTLRDYQAISASVDWLWDQLTKGSPAAWRPAKTVIGSHLAAMAQEGASPEEYSGYFADAADALSAVQYGHDLDEEMQIDIAMLMKLFEFFVKFILPLIIR